MYPKYKCFGCGNIWHSGEILAICPVCRGKGVKIKDRLDVKKVAKKLKGTDPIARLYQAIADFILYRSYTKFRW